MCSISFFWLPSFFNDERFYGEENYNFNILSWYLIIKRKFSFIVKVFYSKVYQELKEQEFVDAARERQFKTFVSN